MSQGGVAERCSRRGIAEAQKSGGGMSEQKVKIKELKPEVREIYIVFISINFLYVYIYIYIYINIA